MLKITSQPIMIGTTFSLRNSWRTKVANLLNKDEEDFPFVFKVTENMGQFCLCESVPDGQTKKKQRLLIYHVAVRYLSGIEVEDVNVGLYFTDYLPIENTKLLILNPKNGIVTPVIFKLDISLQEKIPVFNFVLEGILTDTRGDVTLYDKHSWKMLKGKDSYMTDTEKMYQDTFIHKEFVTRVCDKFASYLTEQGLTEDAQKLMERAKIHDNSKINNKDEFRALTGIVNDRSCLRDANSQLSSFKQDSIELHWKHNPHHPEHYSNYEDMTRIDRMEMVCDWMARSLQYGSDLLQFVETRQNERFHFSDLMYDEIMHYCKILVSLFS